MALEDSFAHRRRGSARFATTIGIKGSRTSGPRATGSNNGQSGAIATGTDGRVWRRRGARWRWHARPTRWLYKRIAKRKPSKQTRASVLLRIGHDWGLLLLLAETPCGSSACPPGMCSNRHFCISFVFFKHGRTTREFAIERERCRFSRGLRHEIR